MPLNDSAVQSLRKIPSNRFSRRELAFNLKYLARKRKYGQLGRKSDYHYLGEHYTDLRFGALNLPFKLHLNQIMERAGKCGEKVRWLDVGPGVPTTFMPFFQQLDSSNELIELHTLAPEQILPKRRVTFDPVIGKYTRVDNLEYSQWKPRLKHHVGAIETYNTKKLGEFDVIVSIAGGVAYSGDAYKDTAVKSAKMLAPGGRAFIQYGFKSLKENHRDTLQYLRLGLGRNFKIRSWDKSNKLIEVIRVK